MVDPGAAAFAVAIVALIIYIVYSRLTAADSDPDHESNSFAAAAARAPPARQLPLSPPPACVGDCAEPPAFIPTLYSSADVDELITGELYREGGRMRSVYGARTSHGDEWGLQEYSDAGPGDVGYDVGPLGLDPGSKCLGRTSDDGIPENWNLPSTPLEFYAVVGGDYYGAEGPTPYCGAGLEMTSVGDHRALMN